MQTPIEGSLLRVFLGESDKYEAGPLYEWIVRVARERGLAGATVVRGIEGFGAHSQMHTSKILRLSTDLPIVVEIVDRKEAIDEFIPVIEGAISEGLMTVEPVDVRFYRAEDPS